MKSLLKHSFFSSNTESGPQSKEDPPVDDAQVDGDEHHETESPNEPDGSQQEDGCSFDSENEDSPEEHGSLLGSDNWMTAEELETANSEAASVKDEEVNWDELKNVCSKIRNGMPCELGDGFAVGSVSLVRKVTFEDGEAWVARVRYNPLRNGAAGYYLSEHGKSMVSEVATLKYLKSRTSIPVPEVYGYDKDKENPVGAEYVLMEYIHGTPALDMGAVPNSWRNCDGSAVVVYHEDDTKWEHSYKFRKQLAAIQTELATVRFDQIGCIYEDPLDTSGFTIGAEPRKADRELGGGPYKTSPEFFHGVARHASVASWFLDEEVDRLDEDGTSSFPFVSECVMTKHRNQSLDKGPFGLAHRRLGSHTVLVNENFEILALLGIRDIMAAPVEMQAQFPMHTGLDFKLPSTQLFLPRGARWKPADKFKDYVDTLRECEQTIGADIDELDRPAAYMMRPGALAYLAILWYDTHDLDTIDNWMCNVLRLLGFDEYPFFRYKI